MASTVPGTIDLPCDCTALEMHFPHALAHFSIAYTSASTHSNDADLAAPLATSWTGGRFNMTSIAALGHVIIAIVIHTQASFCNFPRDVFAVFSLALLSQATVP